MRMRPTSAVLAGSVLVLLLAGCAGGAASSLGAAAAGTPSPTPTIACPATGEWTDEPCFEVDHEAAMALNDRHRGSAPQTDEQRAGTDQWVEPARSALEPVAASGAAPTTEAVVEALAALGLGEAQVAGGGDSVVFGLSTGTGCVRGIVGPGRLEVRGDGYILDGGCLPAN